MQVWHRKGDINTKYSRKMTITSKIWKIISWNLAYLEVMMSHLIQAYFHNFFFLIKHVSRSVYHGNGWKKNEILLPNSYSSINANNKTWFSLYRPSKFVSFKFFKLFTNLTEKLGYHSNEIGKKLNISLHTVFFHQRMIWYCMGNNWIYDLYS